DTFATVWVASTKREQGRKGLLPVIGLGISSTPTTIMGRTHLTAHVLLVTIWVVAGRSDAQQTVVPSELPPQDGFYNNLLQPDWGTVGSRLVRKSRAAYSDGAYQMAGPNRPNPLDISQQVHSGAGGTASEYGRNAMAVFFAQLVLDEILWTGQPGCPPEYENLPIPPDHPLANATKRPMVYQRSGYDGRTGNSPNTPRQQTNGVTPYLDGGVIYGTSRMWTNHLRDMQDGTLMTDSKDLKTSFPAKNTRRLPLSNQPVPRDHSLKPVSRLFAIGNAKGHESPFLLALQIVWHRYHNVIALRIKNSKPTASNEDIFNLARKRVIAHFQKIVVKEWLPAFLNGAGGGTSPALGPYSKYNPEERPDIAQEFRTAFNFRYSLMPGAVWTLGNRPAGGGHFQTTTTAGRGPQNEARDVTSVRTCNHFWDSQDLLKEEDRVEEILRGMIYTRSEKEDAVFVPDVRESFYGPFEFSRLDAVALKIQRDRDHGVSDLNTVLEQYDQQTIDTWAEMGAAGERLRSLYSNSSVLNDVDLFSGAMLAGGNVSGIPTIFRNIILQQFARIRESDRFWYENNQEERFDAAERAEIANITFKEVLKLTTQLTDQDLAHLFTCEGGDCKDPPSLADTSDPTVDVCTPLQTYDYFTGSEVSFALSWVAIALVIPASIGVLLLLAKRRERYRRNKMVGKSRDYRKSNPNKFKGPRSGERNVSVEFDSKRKKILVRDGRGKELRFIDLRQARSVTIRTPSESSATIASLSVAGEVDLILVFVEPDDCQNYLTGLKRFLEGLGVTVETQIRIEAEIKGGSNNKDDRQGVLNDFFREISRVNEVVSVRLTRTEFAEALGMQPSSIFVRNIFLLADTDNDGFVSFQEFLGLFGTFLKGSAEEKARLMFNVYDVRRRGVLTRDDFQRMIKSLLELSENPNDLRDESTVAQLVDVMFREAGVEGKDTMTFEDFRKVFASREYASTLQKATLGNQGAAVKGITNPRDIRQRKSVFINSYRKKQPGRTPPSRGAGPRGRGHRDGQSSRSTNRRSQVHMSVHKPERLPQSTTERWCYTVVKFVELYSLQIFWVSLYTLVTCDYAKGREAAGLRRLSGAWTTAMIRGSASVIMFTYVSLLVTMCRNIITRLRETILHRFIPFDSAVSFHKYIGVLAMIATIVHIFGHAVNLYCMCTQSTTNINCFFREYFTASDGFATFHFWAFQTITGLAGVLVTIVIFIMYVFAHQWARRKVFTAFWFTHSLYPLVYILTFLHGIGRLVQDPLFPWYLIGPLVLFVFDRLTSASRNKIEIPVIKAELLPSDVILLVFKRPSNFAYKSGQWVRIACIKLGKEEYHPFTLTSAPHERHLSLHIRAVGPWTTNLRQTYDKDVLGGDSYPKLYLDGPFGEGHQDWYTYDVAVLVGGGIGVTPFASILKDIAFKSRTGALITCKKVYFIWVTRTQKSFEWMTEVIRDAEDTDTRGIVDTHIFVTQFQQKYDLRTTMLYICERHFQKVEGRSLFTGLKATTHFGRPDFVEFLFSLQLEHPAVERIGVFSCGPGPMTSSVQTACTTLNRQKGATYTHHYENF
ncbi:hypothetical protein BaRGS_00009046, partial [Batillaria attramentaria]